METIIIIFILLNTIAVCWNIYQTLKYRLKNDYVKATYYLCGALFNSIALVLLIK